MDIAIKVCNLQHTFKEKVVLNNISFNIGKGKIFGLLGPSGAGKTTLINILTGQLKATGGSSAVFGIESLKMSGEDYKKIGVGSLVIGLAGGYLNTGLLRFMLIMLLGHCVSVLLGAAIGVVSKNQMMGTSLTVPVMMILSFLPMLSMFNETIGRVAKYVFSQQLYLMLNNMNDIYLRLENIVIMGGNIVLVLTAFLWAYKKAFVNK